MPPVAQLRVVDPVITSIAQGFIEPSFIGTEILPVVELPKQAGKVVEFGKEAFMIYNSRRAPRAQSARVEWGTTTKDVVTQEHSLEGLVDDTEREEAIDPIDPEIETSDVVMRSIELEMEFEIANKLTNAATWATGHSETLAGTAQWTDFTNSDPLADVKAKRALVRSKIGVYPNRLTLGATTFETLSEHPKIIDRIKFTMGSVSVAPTVTAEILAQLFRVEKVLVGEPVVSDDSGVFSDIWGDVAILSWRPPRPGRKIPSLGYTLKRVGYPKAEKYREERNKSDVFNFTDFYEPTILANFAGYLWLDTNA